LTERDTLHTLEIVMTLETSYPFTSRADVATDVPARYAKQLVSHLGRKVEFVSEGNTHTAAIGSSTAQIVIGDGVLTLLAAAQTESEMARIEHALGGHLERFGQRAELNVSWDRSA
jgi:hypothetical protein